MIRPPMRRAGALLLALWLSVSLVERAVPVPLRAARWGRGGARRRWRITRAGTARTTARTSAAASSSARRRRRSRCPASRRACRLAVAAAPDAPRAPRRCCRARAQRHAPPLRQRSSARAQRVDRSAHSFLPQLSLRSAPAEGDPCRIHCTVSAARSSRARSSSRSRAPARSSRTARATAPAAPRRRDTPTATPRISPRCAWSRARSSAPTPPPPWSSTPTRSAPSRRTTPGTSSARPRASRSICRGRARASPPMR